MSVADRVLGFVEHLRIDEQSDAILEALAVALSSPLERAHLVAHGNETIPPGAVLRDPRHAPLWALPSAAQWTGGTMPARLVGESDEAYLERARTAVVRPRGMLRGSSTALAELVRPHLTDSQLLTIVEKYRDDPRQTLLVTYEPQTPDPDEIVAIADDPSVVVTGSKILYRTDPGWSVGQLEDEYAPPDDVADVEAAFATVNDVETRLPNA